MSTTRFSSRERDRLCINSSNWVRCSETSLKRASVTASLAAVSPSAAISRSAQRAAFASRGGDDDLVAAMHAIEHVYEWEAPQLLAEWKRLLQPGGLLVLELPNIEHAARNLLAGMSPQMCMFPLYGDGSHRDPYMCHRFGYTPKTIAALLKAGGFIGIRHLEPRTHGGRANRDMRVEARRA